MKRLSKLLTIPIMAGILLAPAKAIPWTHLDEISKQAKKVASEISYVNDKGGNHWNSPEKTRKDKEGDCEDHAILLREELLNKKIPVEFCEGPYYPRNHPDYKKDTGHAWLQYRGADGKEYV